MIRVIQRRLIIPRGDTGTFTLPLLPGTEEGETAVFSIYDPLTKEVLLQKLGVIDKDKQQLKISFAHEDTMEIEPSRRYEWDVTIYKEASDYDENGIPHNGTQVNSYYAAFSLPVCEIREAP